MGLGLTCNPKNLQFYGLYLLLIKEYLLLNCRFLESQVGLRISHNDSCLLLEESMGSCGYHGVPEPELSGSLNSEPKTCNLKPQTSTHKPTNYIYQHLPCTLNWGYMVPTGGYLGPNRG